MRVSSLMCKDKESEKKKATAWIGVFTSAEKNREASKKNKKTERKADACYSHCTEAKGKKGIAAMKMEWPPLCKQRCPGRRHRWTMNGTE